MATLLDRFTSHLKHVISRAGTIATECGSVRVEPAHLLLGLALERGSIGHEILSKARIKADVIRIRLGMPAAAAKARSAEGPMAIGPLLSEDAKRALEKAALSASTHAHRYVGTEHLLAGIMDINNEQVRTLLTEARVDPSVLQQHLTVVLTSTSKFSEFTGTLAEPTITAAPNTAESEASATAKTPALDFFAKDLTAPSATKTIDPVIGREAEIERVIQILCRRTKNNPILVGQAGVGKTAIVEGLARKVVERDVPDILIGKRILALDLALVVAGTIYRGEFESRLKQILDEVRQDKDLILFIDEIHTIMGAGAASGSLDAANILKPALARGDIRCIGATTYEEYKKHVENDPALERRFQSVHVAAPSLTATAEILHGLKPYYEQFHHVRITDAAIDAAVRFSDRYITDRQFPDKAIDLIDEASARLRVTAKNDPLIRRANAIDALLEGCDAEKRAAVLEERFADATAVQRKREQLAQERLTIHAQIKQRKVVDAGAINERHVAAVVGQMIGLPAEEILLEEHERLRRLGDDLRARIVGQEEAVTKIAAALQRAKSGLASPSRPLASFLLLGPTGVGKTETAKALAELCFQHRDALIRLDMSEFSEGFTISKLIGAPAGYVGYREGSKLTDAIRKRPASVVLFDEIEKAHADVWNLLLQILEDGRLTDATGRESRFTNAIIVLTSNLGAGAFTKTGIGFLEGALTPEGLDRQYADIRLDAIRELKSKFRPELLNRIDETVVYRPLAKEHLAVIAQMAFDEFALRLQKEHRMTATKDPSIDAWIAERAFDPGQGARAIRRLLHEHVENPIATGILEERFRPGGTIIVTRAATGDRFEVFAATSAQEPEPLKQRAPRKKVRA